VGNVGEKNLAMVLQSHLLPCPDIGSRNLLSPKTKLKSKLQFKETWRLIMTQTDAFSD
jgi:hypothetical protein